ncbi:alpha/beta hydrolase [Aspergillus lucknowensis]|uniref:Alpha/Beta hydrolase protein n=1 Tax=Aspergillus lucknowensis TaxID=176173 RepID=A0ABR4LXI2_9EURO
MKVIAAAASLWLTMVAAHASGFPPSFNTSKLTFYPAPENNGLGVGVLVLPGGGYIYLSPEEASNSTTYLNAKGYDAWVLEYSVASTAPTPLYPVPQEEAVAAVKYIRSQTETKVKKLGIWGYSAGGHLAAVTVTNPEADLDFGILAYPVISMDDAITHQGSRHYLLGDNPPAELVEAMSAENRVTPATPPIFIYHSADDETVPVENTLRFISALTKKSRPYQALIIPDGEHGIALALDDPQRNWSPELDRFLKYSI